MNHETVLVSACLLGLNCRHDGTYDWCPEVSAEIRRSHFCRSAPSSRGD